MPRADLQIPGESAVVTASGSGIGRQIAAALAESGVDVALNDVEEATLADAREELDSLPGRVIAVQGDASDPDDMARLVDEAVDAFGGLAILVNNVGIAGPTKPCEEVSFEEFMDTLEVNLGGHFNATRAAVPHLRDAETGRIVNLSSMSGKRPLADRTPYTTAKMGVIGFVRTLAVELADDDVTVNAICPGSVEGPRLEAVIEGQAQSQGRPYEEVEREFRSVSPMNEFTQPSDIASAVLFLCSDRGAHITGQDINVTAGVCQY
jgi:NAD(P)-dependent dehydrogenase (short-subunit alcohol dehydrogenase family)